MPSLQPPIALPREDALPRVVQIRHPDYPASENTLLELRALDDDGIDYDTVMAACSIVTGNTSTGFLATRAGARLKPVVRPDDGILGASEYFFQLPDDAVLERPYPVVARFDDWTFPHAAMPSPWDQLRCRAEGGTSCRVTDSRWGTERAHLVPLTVQGWWDRESLRHYVASDRFSQRPIDADDNTIRLRSDIHTVFDDKTFAIVPKRDQTGRLAPVVHMVNSISDTYFHRHYHNREILPLWCSVECLFARFAWSLFQPAVLVFLSSCITSRRVLLYDSSTGTSTVESRNHEQVRAMLAASRSRSASPRKRPAYEVAGGTADATDGSPDSGFESRGRSRKRPADPWDPDHSPKRQPRKRLCEEPTGDSTWVEEP
jgi:hypothetical protein